MSTGNPDFTSPTKPEQKKEIPPSWFYGIGDTNHGIQTLSFSPEFYNLGEQKVQEITGFTMEELKAKKDELEKEYKGKTKALFKFHLSKPL